MKQRYINTDIENKKKRNDLYCSRFDRTMIEVSNYYANTIENTEGSHLRLPTIVNSLETKSSKKNIIARYVSPEPPTSKLFKNIYKKSNELRNHIDKIKVNGYKRNISLEDYHIKIV
jgi:hypothetical protein